MELLAQFTRPIGLSLTSLSFLYVALPLAVILHRLCPAAYRVGALLGISLLYYFLVEPSSVMLMAASVLADYLVIRLMKANDDKEWLRRGGYWSSMVKNLALLLLAVTASAGSGTPMPVGVMVLSLSGMGAVTEMYRRETSYELDVLKFGLYCCFFPRLYAGPLYTYREFDKQMMNPKGGLVPVASGMGQFILGAFKAAVIGGQMAEIYRQLRDFTGEDITVLSSWLMLFTFALALYFPLSGFSDMAQGIGLIFGFVLPKNFYYPYQSRSVTDFFERFQSTVTAALRRFLRCGEKDPPRRPLPDIAFRLLCGMLLGLWFGLRVNYLVWGAYLALFAVMEQYLYPKLVEAIPVLPRRILALCVVLSSFTILSGESLAESMGYIGNMLSAFTGSLPWISERLLYLLSSNWLVLGIGCLFATNLIDVTGRWLVKTFPQAAKPARLVVFVCVLGLYTAMVL